MGNLGFWSIALAAGGCACLAALAIIASGACVVAPTSDAPVPPVRRPTIVHTRVDPPSDMLLTEWPTTGFTVEVLLGDPSDFFVWEMRVDGDVVYLGPPNGRPRQAAPSEFVNGLLPLVAPSDPGTFIDKTQCHTIEVLVGHDFAPVTQNSVINDTIFDSIGGDSVWWYYVGPRGPGACGTYNGDAGATDASIDILPVPPVEGGGDP